MSTLTTKRGWIGRLLAVAVPVGAMMLAAQVSPARAAGLLIADGGLGGVLEVEQHEVHVTINNGIAVTEVNQTFRNTENRQVEALYVFPVPKGASVANFSMWINGKEMVGEVVEKQRARQIYESYKATRRDPGLLEQVDYKNFELRIFPIGPKAEQKIQITYYQELDYDHDWATYVYPLATVGRTGLDARTKGKFALTMQVKSEVPITELESPSHGKEFAVVKHTDAYYEASLETRGGDLNRDLVLAYHVERPRTGIDAITSKQPDEDGYFMLTLTAGEELAQADRGMDYVFLLDVSGSMAFDGKLRMSRESIDAFLAELGPEDRLEVITFNVAPTTLFNQLRKAGPEAREEAARFLRSQEGRGGTVLRPAMAMAYKYGEPDRPLNVVILSDGMTEQRERSELLSLIGARPANARVFCIGVGNEVNRPLLSQLAEETGGLAAFLSHGDDFARQAKAFRRKLMRPAADDVRIDVEGVEVYDVEPRKLPSLYHGMPVRLYGRYRKPGMAKIRVQAEVNGAAIDQAVELKFPDAEPANPEIQRMWAWRRVDQLLKEADRTGSRSAVTDEIVRLGETYSIVTEYTSFIVLENDAEYQRWKIDRRNLSRIGRDRKQQEAVQAQLAALREKALADLGPTSTTPQTTASEPAANPAQPQVAQRAAPQPNTTGRDLDFLPRPSGGGGSVEWLFLAGLGMLGFGRMVTRHKGRHA